MLHDICTTVGANLCPEVDEYWTASSNAFGGVVVLSAAVFRGPGSGKVQPIPRELHGPEVECVLCWASGMSEHRWFRI